MFTDLVLETSDLTALDGYLAGFGINFTYSNGKITLYGGTLQVITPVLESSTGKHAFSIRVNEGQLAKLEQIIDNNLLIKKWDSREFIDSGEFYEVEDPETGEMVPGDEPIMVLKPIPEYSVETPDPDTGEMVLTMRKVGVISR